MSTNSQERPSGRIVACAIVGIITTLSLWSLAVTQLIVPALWGPYAEELADAGPLALSRGGLLFCFFALPLATIIHPLRLAPPGRLRLQYQVIGTVVTLAAALAYGYYLHNIVYYQGVRASLEFYAAEVGYKSGEEVPPHIRQAFERSDDNARHGRLTWLPGGWHAVAWPTTPHN